MMAQFLVMGNCLPNKLLMIKYLHVTIYVIFIG